jgi:polysaccharide biosynthesis transport protein
MTTLPQTTPMRAPRPGNGQLAMPGAYIASPAAAPGGLSGADVWRVLRANLWLIVGTLMVAGIAGYIANMWLLNKYARYTSVELLSVRESIPRDIYQNGDSINPAALEVEQRTQAKQLTNESLLASVLADSTLIRETDWFKQFITFKDGHQVVDVQAAKQDLLEHLDVTPVTNSRLIEVRMTYSVPKDCRTILTEICNRHIKDVRQRQNADQEGRIQSLNTMKVEYDSRLATQRDVLDRLARTLSDNGVSLSGASSKQIELQELINQRSEAMKIEIENGTKLEKFKASMANGTAWQITQALNNDNQVASLRQTMRLLEVELASMELNFGKDNKRVADLQVRIQKYQQQLDDAIALVTANVEQMYTGEYESLMKSAKDMHDQLQKHIDGLVREISDLSSKQLEYERRMQDLRELNIKRDHVDDEKDKMTFASRFSSVEEAQPANIPDFPTFPKLSIVLTLAMLMGLGLSVGIAFLRELTDTTVRSPRDIARVGQMTLLGMIPHQDDDPQLSGGRLPLAIYEAPHSMIAEQFRQVRTRLQHAASLDTTRSILVTGCNPEDGKTTVASNIAAGLALNGRRILLVDANFRRPNIHSIFGIGNEAGLGDVLNAPELFDECIRETEVPNLSIMTTGARPRNSTELLESQLLIDFIERALQEYDHVIFDSGPLLMVSDSIALAPRVDGVITVVRARGNSRGLLQRVRDELRRLKAEHLGVVLNAVRSQGGGYYGPMIKNYYAYQNR